MIWPMVTDVHAPRDGVAITAREVRMTSGFGRLKPQNVKDDFNKVNLPSVYNGIYVE